MASVTRLLLLRLRHRVNWRLIKLALMVLYLGFMFLVVISLIRHDFLGDGSTDGGGGASQRHKAGGRSRDAVAAAAAGEQLGPVPKEVRDFEALVVPGEGEGGKGVRLEKGRDVQKIMKKYAFNKVKYKLQ